MCLHMIKGLHIHEFMKRVQNIVEKGEVGHYELLQLKLRSNVRVKINCCLFLEKKVLMCRIT